MTFSNLSENVASTPPEDKLRLGCAADIHIHNDATLREAVTLLGKFIDDYRPDLMICLGDSFDDNGFFRKYGNEFKRQCRELHPHWVFCYGNHDGEGSDDGYDSYLRTFPSAQQQIEFKGRRIVSFADMYAPAGGREFALENTIPGAIVCCHANQPQEYIEQLAAKGAILVLTGHKHYFHVQRCGNGKCEQLTIPPFRFGGMNGEAAGCAIIDVDKNSSAFYWIRNCLSAFPGNQRIWSDQADREDFLTPLLPDSHFSGDPDRWLLFPPLENGNRKWEGGPSWLRAYENGELRWEKSYGRTWVDNCPLILHRYQEREYLIMGTTWLKSAECSGPKDLNSLLVVDAVTGTELYRLPIVGMSVPPTIVDGVIYAAGQWREIMAVDLPTGKVLWRQRSQPEPDAFSWYDNRTGGGWSVCPAAVGKHVWTVNSRGDLFGYRRQTGDPAFIYPGIIPLNDVPSCPYAPHLGFCSREYGREKTADGDMIFTFNGCSVNDTTGQYRYAETVSMI